MFPATLRREIILLLCVKAVVLAVIYFMFFVPATKPGIDGDTIRAHFIFGRAD